MRRNRRAWATLAALVLTVGSIGASPTAAHAGGDHGGGSGSSSCGVYPIAATSSVLSKARVGSVVSDLTVGTPSGHEGWLTWTGDVSEPALAKSLTPPGDSGRYVNPDDPTDRLLSLGDFVGGKPGVVASHAVRTALGKLIGKRIVVPTWDSTRGTGSKLAYHVNGFASVELTSYDLRAGTRISAKYFGPSTCASPKEAPVAKPASATTAEDQPVTISLTGTSKDSSSDLTFRLSAPAHGAVSVVGAPSCRRDDDEKSPKVWWPSFVAYGSGGGDRKGHGAPGHDDDDDGVTCTVDASYVPTADYNGSDQFTFTVSADKVTSTPATVTITVTEVNDPPIAGADSAAAGSEPLKLGVATLLANDTPGPANEAGQTLTVTAVNAGADTHGTVTLADGTVTYVAAPGFAGVATFTYRVCDNGTTAGRPDPRCADGVVSVTVAPPANQPPVADPQTVQAVEDTALPITLTGSDPDGDALTFTVVSGPSHGTLSGTAPQLTYTPAPDYFGPDEFSFTVSDSRATSTPAKVSITVSEVNDPPVPGADSASGTAGQTVTLTVAALLANDVPGPANEADQLLDIESVDGGPGTHGTVVLDAGTITYTPEPGFSGSASFTYSVCDNGTTAGAPDRRCANGTVTVQLNGVNQPPVANDGTIAAVEDTPVHVTLTGSDPDGDPLVFAVTNPGSGTLSGTGADLIYTPAANFFGPDSFTFTVSDGRATSVPATVSITVSEVNDPPVVGTDSLPAPGHQPSTITAASLLLNDVPGPSNESTQTPAVAAVHAGPDTHGTVTLTRGTVTYIPDAGYAGPAAFADTVCDNGTTAGLPDPLCVDGVVTLTVTPAVNGQPIGIPASLDAVEDTPLPISLTGDDADGDPLVFTVVSTPSHGALSGTAPELTYTPAPDYFGADQFSFTVFDGLATSVPVVVSIAVSEVNDPPISGNDAVVVGSDHPSTLDPATLLINDVAGPANEAGQILAVTAVAGDADTHGSVTLNGGVITYTPDAGFTGTASFGYTVCDNGTTGSHPDPRCATGGKVSVDVVAPDQPPVADPQNLTVAEDHPLPLVLTGSDPEGRALTFAIAAAPAHGTLSGTAPALTYTPAIDYFGPDSFTFTTNDGATSSLAATVTITVTEVNDPPRIGADEFTLGGGGVLPPPPPAPPCGTPCGVIFGDPHLLTFDKAPYDAQAVGELIAAKSTTDDFEVQARFAAVPGSRTVSIDTALAMRVAGHRVTMYRTLTGLDTRLDGNLLTVPAFPQALPGGGTIGTYGLDGTVIVVWPDGSRAIVRAVGVFPEYYRFTLNLGLAPARLGHVAGLLGDANGTTTGELVTRGGVPVTYPNTPFAELYGTYVNSWRISNAESMFDYGAGQTTETFTDLTYPDAPVTPQTLPAAARASATATCNLFGLTTQQLLDACIVDVGTTGDADFASSSADAQQNGLGIPTNAGTTSLGAATTIVTTAPGENAVRTFAGPAGQKVTLTISANSYSGGADFTVRAPNGSTVASIFVTAPTGFRDVFTLPATGTYTFVVDPRDQQTGTATYVLGAVPDNTGTTSIGTATTVTTTVIGENPERTFPGTAGQKLTLTVSANSYSGGADFTVRAPNGSTVTSIFVSAATGFRDVFTLPTTGTYTFVVDPRDQQTGTATFVLGPVPDNTGTTSIGTATTVTTTVIGENAERTFAGTAGQKLTLTVSANSYSGGADFLVRAPSGSTVTSLFVSAATGFRDVFTLPSTGTYTFVVDPRDQQTGTATYVLGAVPDNTGTTSIGTATTVTTTVIGENPERTFPGTAGQKLTLTVSANSYSGGADFIVRAPSGSTVTSIFVSAATGFRDVFTLPTTGTYTFVVDPRDQQTGTATFLLSPVPDNTGTTTIGTATTVTTTVIGENAERTFAGTAGQKLTLTVSANSYSGGADFLVRAPSGSTVTSLFVSAATGFRDVFTLPTTGTYTMVVDPRDQQTGTATYVLGAVPDNTGTTSVGTATTVTTTVIGENAERTFPGTTGQRLTLTVSANSYSGGVDFIVRAPSGSTVTSLFVSAATGFRDVFTLPSTGTYTMVVDPRDQQTGTATFLLAAAPAGTGAAAPFLFSAAPAGTGAAASLTAAAARTGLVAARLASFAAPQSAVAAGASIAAAAAAAAPTLTITVAELLANDRPGPDNESAQTLTVTGVSASPFTHGTVSFAAGVVSYTPDADFIGNASFSYTVCDDGTTNGQPDPRCTTGSVTVKVTANHPPVIQPQTLTTSEDTPVGLTLTGSDPEGDPITFVVASTPGHGTLSGTPPALTYTPAPDFNGTDTFTYTANDGRDQSAPATVTVNVSAVNDPPVPQPDTVTARAGQTVTVPAANLTTNDAAGPFDERFQALTVTAVTPGANTHGAVALAAGTVTFTPDAGFSGTAVIGYTVCDNGTTDGVAAPLCADSTLSIVANRPPTANPQSAQTSLTKPVALALTATDPDGDTLTYAIAASPQHGTLTGSAPNVTYTAASGFVGGDSFTFTAADAYGASAPATVSITVADVPSPTLGADAATVQAGRSVLVDVLANDTPGSGTIAPATLAITAAPAKGTAVVDSGQARYTANAGTSGSDAFSYTVCDTGGGCGTAVVTMTITENRAPTATDDSYDIAAGATLHPLAPGVLGNDTDPDTGDKLQARLVRGVTNGRLLLYGTGAFTYTPNGPGIDTFVYHVVDSSGAVSNDATVTIYVTGPPGPPSAGNDLYQVQTGRELVVPAPGVMDDDFSPNPRLTLTALLQGDAAKGTLLLHGDGSFTYTPKAGYTGLDRFSYVVRDSQGRVSATANVGITVTAGGPPTATVAAISPAAGTVLTGPTHITATLAAPAGETVTTWTVSYRRPGDPAPTQLASGSGTALAADFDPTTVRDGTYDIVIRAVTSGGGILVSETGVSVDGRYKPGRYATTYRDVAANSANIPIDLLRTYDSINKTSGDLGVGWSLQLANFRVDTNGPLGSGTWTPFTCGAFPFLATWYTPSTPHFVTITWPDGHLERFRFEPNKGSSLVPTLTTAGFVAEPGTTSTLSALDDGLLLSGGDFLLGNFFFADGVYDPSGFVLTDKTGTKYTLDRRAGLLKIVDRNGNSVSIGSDGIDASSGLSMTFTRDAANRITRVSAPGGNIDYTYDAAGDLVGVSYPNGTTQSFTYDARHDLLTTSGGGQLLRTLHYDPSGRLTAITDGNGKTTAITIDVAGHQQVITDPTGALTTVNTYSNRGDVLQQDRVSGGRTITTHATYDAVGRQLTSTDGLGHTVSQTYDAAGNVLTTTDANGRTTTSTYNAFGQPLTMTDPLGHVTRNVYDARGNLVESDAPDGGVTTYTYDAHGNALTVKDPTGRVTTSTYDTTDHLASTTDPGGHTTHQTVDTHTGRIMSVTDPTGATSSFGYDAHGNLTRTTDANGHVHTATYDAFDHLTSLTDATGATSTTTYDPAGNVISVTDRNGQTTTFAYDANSRLVTKTVPGAGTTTYTYDGFGRRTTATNATAQLAYTYDDADHVLSVTSTPTTPGALPTTTFTSTFDAAGMVTSVQGPGGTTTYAYDADSRLTTLTDPAGGAFGFGYDAAGRQTSMTRPNGIADTIVHDLGGHLTSLHSTVGSTLMVQADYTYDATGMRDTFTTQTGTASYGYDAASQLTSATFPAGAGLPNEQYTYDPTGNRTSSATQSLGSSTFDSANRLLQDATATYQYDKEGNLVSRTVTASGATTTFSWTAEHHLLGITYPNGSTSTFRYDPAGRRVEIVDGATTTRYAFDGQAIAAEYDGASALVATYVHHPTSPTTTYEMTRGGQRYFYLTDALGSTTHLVTAGGAVANSYTYGAFGVPTQTGAVENPFTYTGQLFDRQAGLYLFPVRAYDPTLGRFIGEDPNPSANAYPYVKNNPTNSVDPSGASSTSETVIEDTAINPFAQTYIRGGGARIGTRCFFLVFETLAFAAFGSASWSLDPFLIDLIHQRAIQLCESI